LRNCRVLAVCIVAASSLACQPPSGLHRGGKQPCLPAPSEQFAKTERFGRYSRVGLCCHWDARAMG